MKIEELNLTELYDLADEAVNYYHQQVKNVGAIGYNKGLLNSTANVKVNGSVVSLYFELPEYYYYVENGRKPSANITNPPVVYNEILKWVKAKGIMGWLNSRGKEMTQEQIASAVYHSIMKKGYTGKKPLENAVTQIKQSNIPKRMADIIGEQFSKDLHNELMKLKTIK